MAMRSRRTTIDRVIADAVVADVVDRQNRPNRMANRKSKVVVEGEGGGWEVIVSVATCS